MPQRMGKYTIELTNTPSIIGYAAVVGEKEAKGPLGQCFDKTCKDAFFGEKTFEKAETKMLWWWRLDAMLRRQVKSF